MKIISQPTAEDIKGGTPAFDPDKHPDCPKCGAEMLRYKTGKKSVYLQCKACNRRYRGERIQLVERPIIKIYPASTGDFYWLVNIMRPAAEAVRKALIKASTDKDCTLSMRNILSELLEKPDERMVWDILHFQDDTEWINHPQKSQEQADIRSIINEALEKALDPDSIKKIIRFVYYAVSLRDYAYYTSVLQDWEKPQDAISMDLKLIANNSLRTKHKRP